MLIDFLKKIMQKSEEIVNPEYNLTSYTHNCIGQIGAIIIQVEKSHKHHFSKI